MKIVYCINSTEPKYGGTEIVTVMKANALAEIEGNEVWILVTDQLADSDRTVSSKVHVIDLNIDYYDDDNYWMILRSYTIKRWKHKIILERLLNQILPDVVVSTSQMEKYMIPKISYKRRPFLVRELHFCSQFRVLSSRNLFQKIIAKITSWYDYKWQIKGYDKIVVLTEEDHLSQWKNNPNVVVIPNPLNTRLTDPIVKQLDMAKRKNIVIAVGRLVFQKNFESAIRVWKIVAQKHNDWILQIWGDGCERNRLQNYIKMNSLEKNVQLMGYTSDILEKMSCTTALIMTSLYEGFPMTIIEGMSVGLPVISFTFPCGPKDIITNGVDGFLVEDRNEKLMAEKICLMIENKEMQDRMSQAAIEKSKMYTINSVIPKWMSLFEKNIARIQSEKKNK